MLQMHTNAKFSKHASQTHQPTGRRLTQTNLGISLSRSALFTFHSLSLPGFSQFAERVMLECYVSCSPNFAERKVFHWDCTMRSIAIAPCPSALYQVILFGVTLVYCSWGTGCSAPWKNERDRAVRLKELGRSEHTRIYGQQGDLWSARLCWLISKDHVDSIFSETECLKHLKRSRIQAQHRHSLWQMDCKFWLVLTFILG